MTPLLRFGERPVFDELPDAQPAAVLNVTARYAPGIGVRQRLARRHRIRQSTKTTWRLIAVMAARVLLRLLRGCRPEQTDTGAIRAPKLKESIHGRDA
jgi:hypothetical protein